VGERVGDHTSRVVALGRPGTGSRAATDEDVLLRLALWLADVAAETSVGKSAP
jgi:hypothetical protein